MKTIRHFIAISFILVASLFLVSCASTGKPSMTAAVEVAPATGVAASDIKITGKGFQADEEIDILFVLEETMKIGIGTAKVEVIKTDGSGNFAVDAAIPVNAKPGKYRIDVVGNKDSQAATSVEVIKK